MENQPRAFESLLNLAEKEDLPQRIKELRFLGLDALIDGLNRVLPENLIAEFVKSNDDALHIDHEIIPYKSFSEIIIVGGGKATGLMCKKMVELIGEKIPFKGSINIPYGQTIPDKIYSVNQNYYVDVHFCAHPVPDEAGIKGVENMLQIIDESPQDAIIIALISGGGSSLMPYPAEGITLDNIQQVNKLLLASGAEIHEINCIRKHLSAFKGGQLSTYAANRRLFSLIISDVIGNDVQTIASGPTVPDLTDFNTAYKISQKYSIFEKYPLSVQSRIQKGMKGEIQDTPKPNAKIFDTTTNIIIGSAETSAKAVKENLLRKNVETQIFSHELNGEARQYGKDLVDSITKFKIQHKTAAFIGTGEFTVSIRGEGRGGRNQEMLLGFLNELAHNLEYKAHQIPFVIISGAFDGIEGNSPAMGALIDSYTIERCSKKQIGLDDFGKYLAKNDSFSFFQQLQDNLITGQTGTNVNDMLIILIDQIEQ